MNAIKLLDNMEVGIPLIITTKWQEVFINNVPYAIEYRSLKEVK